MFEQFNLESLLLIGIIVPDTSTWTYNDEHVKLVSSESDPGGLPADLVWSP